jgi:hypothetical protein
MAMKTNGCIVFATDEDGALVAVNGGNRWITWDDLRGAAGQDDRDLAAVYQCILQKAREMDLKRQDAARYAVEQNSPDGGRSTYLECWGSTATSRGRVLSGHDTLDAALRAADAASPSGHADSYTWVYDRRARRVVNGQR